MVNKEESARHDYHFWESEVELTRKKSTAQDGKKFRYFDDGGIFSLTFFGWVRKWLTETTRRYLDPYMLHPLPLADQILIWQPILSRHISDGIASLEEWESLGEDEKGRAPKPVKYILWRAIWLTFWKRLLAIFAGVVIVNTIGMSIAIILHRLLDMMSARDPKFVVFFFLALSIILLELFKEITMDHINFYIQRLQMIMNSSVRNALFQHSLCYRRSHFGNFHSKEGSCKSIIHSCSGENMCTYNPLSCPARRHKDNDTTPKLYPLVLNDSYYVALFVECVSGFVEFLTAFIYGLILIDQQFNMRTITILMISLSLVACMVLAEILNGYLFKLYMGVRDNRIAKANAVISGLTVIERMALDDVGQDVITEARNDELVIILLRFLMSLINKAIFTTIICVDIILVVNDFMTQVGDAADIESIRPAELLTAVYILMKIIIPLNILPLKLKFFMCTHNAIARVEAFFRTCSPNFYLPDNKFTGEVSLPETLPDKTETLPKGLMVMFKKASFAWVNSRRDLLDKTGTTCLENIDFILNSGDLAIVTGANGSGKTNFVKAILGDMTLVKGSMAVLPLSTNMPIFYASQDVWIQKGTIRSNIIFGHKFDEDIYNTVIKAIELEHDISTWEEGDMRKISEHGYSLSGGQRMRVGLARAIYAYLIYSKTNREENGSRHSFLVILDDSFTNLDPFVAKIIFKNLFNSKDGLLVKDDMATILTISKRILDACTSSEHTSFPNAPIYTLKDKTLIHDNMLGAFMDHQVGHLESSQPSADRMKLPCGSHDILARCSSDDYTRERRRVLTALQYYESPTSKLYDRDGTRHKSKESFRPYTVYLRAAGIPIFFFLIFTIVFVTLDNMKFIITSKVADLIVDYTKEHDRAVVSLEDIREYSIRALRWVIILSISVTIGSFLRVFTMAKASLTVSRRIHEYAINSLFVNSSAVIKIKKSLSGILTFLYMDTLFIDSEMGYFLHDACLLAIESTIHLLTLLFISPWSTPIALVLSFIIIRYIVCYYVRSCKNIYFARLESYGQMNATIETAISGLPIYRIFKKEWELIHSMVEHVDYDVRCNYLINSAMAWSSIAFRALLSPLALFILLFPLIRLRCFGVEVQVGYYGMAYSIFLCLNGAFTNFIKIYCFFELCMGSIRRFESFVPPSTPIKFAKKRNIHQTDIVLDGSTNDERASSDLKSKIYARRNKEYNLNRPMTFTGFRMFFFRHRVNIFDVSKYTAPGNVRVRLDNVSVFVKSDDDKTSKILDGITCSANTSDIIGIVGRTGAGKSTLLSVLQNLARNREGSVLLDGCDLKDLPKSVTRQVIGVLPQLPFVFRGWTIRRFVDPRMLFDDSEINAALENCGLLKFVENLPGGKGLNTIILPEHYHKDLPTYLKRVYYGPTLKPHDASSVDNVNVDHGAALSNSQLRTLSVARLVLYREFYKVLLIDEPPEDELGENTPLNIVGTPIYELVRTYFQHCTTFIAAHDASVLRLCTSVWVFHDGSLIKTCRTEDIMGPGSLSKIIEGCISQHNVES